MLLILYPVLGSLGAKGCLWGAEIEGIFSPIRESWPRGTYLHIKESVLGGFLANKVHGIHGEHVRFISAWVWQRKPECLFDCYSIRLGESRMIYHPEGAHPLRQD